MKLRIQAAFGVGLAGLLLAGSAAAKVVELSAAEHHTCALLDTGDVRCWGAGVNGRLGYASTQNVGDDETPLLAGRVELGAPAAHIATGGSHSCAILRSGEVRCWGAAERGQLGYGNLNDIGDDEAPASAGSVSVGGKVLQLALGAAHTCALLEGGTVRCWGGSRMLGLPNADDIGDDELPSVSAPTQLGGNAVQITAGRAHTCALLDTGRLRCWGAGGGGRLGYGTNDNIGYQRTPAEAGDVLVGGQVLQVAAGPTHTCALLDGGKVRCFGPGALGALGYGNNRDVGNRAPPELEGDVDVGAAAVQLSAGGYDGRNHTCALLSTGSVRCWGAGAQGQLGHANTNNIGDDETPASAGDIEVGGKVRQVAAGGNHTCALLVDGGVRCWGGSPFGELGYANTQSVGMDAAPALAGLVQLEVPPPARSLSSRLVAAVVACCIAGFGLYRWRKRAAVTATARS